MESNDGIQRQRSSMSIQERIKAMNMIVERDDAIAASSNNNNNHNHNSSSSSNTNNSATAVTPTSREGRDNTDDPYYNHSSAGTPAGHTTKRASVVEMWKKREVAINRSVMATTVPQQQQQTDPKSTANTAFTTTQSTFKFEEKKEETISTTTTTTTTTEAVQQSQQSPMPFKTVTPVRNGPDNSAPSTATTTTTTTSSMAAPRRSNVRESWRKKAGTVQQLQHNNGNNNGNSGNSSNISNSPLHGPVTPGATPSTPLPSHPMTAPVTPGGNNLNNSNNENTTNNAAFDELRSRWAKFGVNHVSRQDSLRSGAQSLPVTPSTATPMIATSAAPMTRTPVSGAVTTTTTFVTPSPATPRNSFKNQMVDSMVSQQQQQDDGTVTGPVQSSSSFLKPRTELPSALPEASPTAGFKHNNQSHFVKIGKKHGSRPTADDDHDEKLVNKIHPKDSTVSPSHSTKSAQKALTARRMRAKQRFKDTATTNNARTTTTTTTTDFPPASPDPQREHMTAALNTPTQTPRQATISTPADQSENMLRSTLPMQSLFGPNSENSHNGMKSYTRVEPPESPFAGRIDRDFTLSISHSDSQGNAEPSSLNSPSSQPEISFDDWAPTFPDDEKLETKTNQQQSAIPESNPSNNDVTTNTERSVSVSSSLVSRASRKLINRRQKQPIEVKDAVATDSMKTNDSMKNTIDGPVDVLSSQGEHTGEDLLSPEQSRSDTSHPLKHFDRQPSNKAAASYNVSPTNDNDENTTIASETTQSQSQMHSTVASGLTGDGIGGVNVHRNRSIRGKASFEVVPNAKEMVTDNFVSEKNANVASFATAYEKMSLKQIASDMKDEASAVIDMEFLTMGMQSASESINRLVGKDIFSTSNSKQPVRRAPSPIEEVAIEVEYIADSD